MSDFFSGLNSGIRFTDAQINQGGPLPGGPYSSYDGKINFNQDLLSGVSPYAGPKGGNMGSDRNYQQIPHRSQQVIPLLHLPKADDPLNECVPISHAVDYGDIAFVLNSDRVDNLIMPSYLQKGPKNQIPGRNVFCNLVTVNYILSGLQRIQDMTANSQWTTLAKDFAYTNVLTHKKNEYIENLQEILTLISTRILPFGICAGSEHQGGKHETGLAPVQAAVNHVTSMTVDGQSRDLVNLWRSCDLNAGDQLIFRLHWLPTQRYTLNHYYKGTVSQQFRQEWYCWQLVPDRFEMRTIPRSVSSSVSDTNKYKDMRTVYDYRYQGYWRLAQTFQHRLKHDENVENYSNDLVFLRGQLLQVTFAPVWIQMDERLPKNTSGSDASSSRSSSTTQSIFTNTNSKKRTFGSGTLGFGATPTKRLAFSDPTTSSSEPRSTSSWGGTLTESISTASEHAVPVSSTSSDAMNISSDVGSSSTNNRPTTSHSTKVKITKARKTSSK